MLENDPMTKGGAWSVSLCTPTTVSDTILMTMLLLIMMMMNEDVSLFLISVLATSMSAASLFPITYT